MLLRPLVHIIFTGGTIAETYDPLKKGYAPSLQAAEVISAVPGIKAIAELEVEALLNLGSADIQPSDWVMISQRTRELLTSPNVIAVIIIHGTDTLEETAYFLDLTITSDKPIVVTGAMRPFMHSLADGPRNILDAVRVAMSPEAAGKGTLVVLAGQVLAARDVIKTHTQHLNSFKSLEFGSLGTVDEDEVRFYREPLRRQTFILHATPALGRVEIIMHYAGADGNVLRGLFNQNGLDGLVVAGTGVGNVSSPMYDAIAEVRERDIPVVMSTRVHTGRVIPLHTSKGRGISLKEIRVVFADNLSPQKARVLLMLALRQTTNPDELQRIFDGFVNSRSSEAI